MENINNPPRLQNKLPSTTSAGLYDVFSEALALYLQTNPWPVGTAPQFVEEFPMINIEQTDVPLDLILGSVVGSAIAASAPNGGVPKSVQTINTVSDPTRNDYTVKVSGWTEEYRFLFQIYSRQNRRANELTDWFQRFIMTMSYDMQFFDARGFRNFRFDNRDVDINIGPQSKQLLFERRLYYTFWLTYTTAKMHRQVTDVDVVSQIIPPSGGSQTILSSNAEVSSSSMIGGALNSISNSF